MIVYTIETGLATTLTDLVEGICFWTMPTNNVWIGFYSFESALYMNSLLAALNSRVLFRQMRNSEGVVEFEFDTRRSDAAAVSGSEQRRKPHHPIVISVTKEVDSSSQKGLGRDVID
ncbi:hypothetical protein HYDPIDRAFT_108991 [Hydnomerulius pinastri MD-312]|nr:hypothetical protein HYDPIDRAFT_108991 [Hydnomerulius pinastri MD-312]